MISIEIREISFLKPKYLYIFINIRHLYLKLRHISQYQINMSINIRDISVQNKADIYVYSKIEIHVSRFLQKKTKKKIKSSLIEK